MNRVRQENLSCIIDEHKKRGVANAAFAEMIGVMPSFLSQIKYGHRPLPESKAREIEEILGLPFEWLDEDHARPADNYESKLLSLFRKADERGKASILAVAEREAKY